MSEINGLLIGLPNENTPGYLRHQIAIDKFNSLVLQCQKDNKPLPPEAYAALIDRILGYVIEPVDRDEARELLLDASKAQYHQILEAITNAYNKDANPTSPEPTEAT